MNKIIMKKEFLSKIFFQILGIVLISFGVAGIILTKLGAGTFDAFCTFLTYLIGIKIENVGTVNLVLNLIIAFIIFLITKNKKIFLSMVVGIVLGVFINFAVIIYNAIFPVLDSGKSLLENIYFGIFVDFIAIFLVGMGAAILLTKNLIMAPYDELVKVLAIKFKSFKTSKIILDSFFLVNAIILGLIVGRIFEQINIFTVITVYGFGAATGFFVKIIERGKNEKRNS